MDDDTVWLADSSLGNRTFSKHQFMDMWDTRKTELNGKLFAILPADEDVKMDNEFFVRRPRRSTAEAVQLQAFRNRP